MYKFLSICLSSRAVYLVSQSINVGSIQEGFGNSKDTK